MSRTGLYQIFDLVAEAAAGPIMLHKKDGPAVRLFKDLVEDKTTTVGQHPADYELRFLGLQDDSSGELTAQGPETVITGEQILEALEKSKQIAQMKQHLDTQLGQA